MREMSAEELSDLLREKNKNITLLDIREPWETEVCQLSGAIHISMMEIPNRLNELDTEAEIVVLCHHGVRSRQVAGFLEASGFSQVSNLVGGIDAWAMSVEPAMARY
jgi:rhodanese-related sulfurtransferase